MKQQQIELLFGEINLITKALSKMSFIMVNKLIEKINMQTFEQINSSLLVNVNSKIIIELSREEIEIIIKALSRFPFKKVNQLIIRINKREEFQSKFVN